MQTGWFTPFVNESFAKEFVFRGGIIGPFNFEDDYAVVNAHAPYRAFVDIKANPEFCWLDSRDNDFGRHVYCVLYPTGTQTLPWDSPGGMLPASNNTIKSSGEVWSVMWNEELKVKHLSIGYPINAYRGNTCGYGAGFGLVCVAQESLNGYKSLRRSEFLEDFFHFPKEYTPAAELPAWWKDYCQGFNCDFN